MTEKILSGPKFKKNSLLASILFLIKGVEDKSDELLFEIKKMLLSNTRSEGFIDDYNNINKNKKFINAKINIDRDNITLSTIELLEYNKKYYLFDKTIRTNFSKNAKLFTYHKFIINEYIFHRIKYLSTNNKIYNLVEEIKIDAKEQQCQQAIMLIKSNEVDKRYKYFFKQLFNDIDNVKFMPIDLFADILRTNIIIVHNNKTKDLYEVNEEYKYIILEEDKNNYIPLFTKSKKIFYQEDDIIQKLKDQYYGNDRRLDDILRKYEA